MEPQPTHRCSLCGKDAEHSQGLLGALVGPVRGAWVHRLCALWSPEVSCCCWSTLRLHSSSPHVWALQVFQTGEGTLQGVAKAVSRGRTIRSWPPPLAYVRCCEPTVP